MKKYILYLITLFVLGVFSFRTFEFYSNKNKISHANDEIIYNAMRIEVIDKDDEFALYGKIESDSNLDILTESVGKIKNVFVNQYDFVKKNQKLAELDDVLDFNNKNTANINIPEIETDIDTKYSEKFIPSKQKIQNMTNKYIISPCNGYIKEIFQDTGATLSYGLTGGQKFASISCADNLSVNTSISTKNAKYIKPGMKVEISSDSFKMISKVKTISKIVNEHGSIGIKIAINKKNMSDFFIDENVDVRIFGKTRKLVKIPLSSVLIGKQDENIVYVVDKNNLVKAINIDIVSSNDEFFFVNGLQNEDILIISAVNLIKPNTKVKYAMD